jgi:chemotaxis protein MotA
MTTRPSWSPSRLYPAVLLAAALGLVLAAVVLGGSPAAFVDAPALLIVVGGTLAVTGSSYAPAELAQAGRSVGASFGPGPPPAALLVEAAAGLAEAGRRDGLLALERRLPGLAAWPTLRRGLQLAIDGAPADAIVARYGPSSRPRSRPTSGRRPCSAAPPTWRRRWASSARSSAWFRCWAASTGRTRSAPRWPWRS